MKSSQSNEIIIPEPTKQEVEEAIRNAKDKYDIVLSLEDAMEYARLTNEFTQWYLIEKESKSPEAISNKQNKELLEKIKGQEVDQTDANLAADASLKIVIQKEKERITNQMKSIVSKYL